MLEVLRSWTMRGHPNLDDLGPALPREQWTLVDAVRHQAAAAAEREFLSFENGSSVSFSEFNDLTDRLGTALCDLGVQPGDRILGLLTNSREFMLAMIATHKVGAIFVPINTELRGNFLEHQVHNSSPRIIVVDNGLIERFDAVDTSPTAIETVLRVNDGSDSTNSTPESLSGASHMPLEPLLETVPRIEALATPVPEDVCTIMYTSGTTGPSKGVLMPQGHCYLFALGTVAAMELTQDDRYFCCMPLFHANGLFMQVYASLLAGASCHVTKRFSVTDWLNIVREEKITVTNALGVMPEFIFRSPASNRDQDHLLTRILAIPVAEEWGEAMEERFGVVLRQGFGMTEVNMVTYSDLDDPVISSCAGPPLSDFFEVIIADPDTDRELPRNEIGEILVRPKVPFCFNVGYFKMPDKTVEAWRNLWFHTGDAGHMDPEGRLFFVDRIKDRIRRRGENISSFELEQTLNEHPSVVESAAVGLRVEGAGGEDEIKVVLAVDGPSPDPSEFLDWCVPRMPRHTVPRYLEFVTELDKTASGKIRKQSIRDAGVTESTWDRESVGYVVRRD
ncbi:MAG TPA: ATP-dependent acyl-CoA ligase [Acidimicrobiaceae bacterium]|nr:ATP-dependent acyl-CoA ligase [Acidimicrobiaceae bacterium]